MPGLALHLNAPVPGCCREFLEMPQDMTCRNSSRHKPVMLAEMLDVLGVRDGGIYVDGTFGAGGYSRAILEAADCQVYAIDRDADAIAAGQTMAGVFAGRLHLLAGRFGDMAQLLENFDISHVDGVVLDIGVSSMQLDEDERGFSFLRDGPLDMRMDREGLSAADVVNTFPVSSIRRIIAVLGEEKRAGAIARAIAARRAEQPFSRTLELSQVIEKVIGRPPRGQAIHPATRAFQALRIFVNGELEQLIEALEASELLLRPGGALVVVTFHSLEDRIVKKFLASRSGHTARPSRHLPHTGEGPAASFNVANRRGLVAGAAELAENPRARSARLRAGIRTGAAAHKPGQQTYGMVQLNVGNG